MKRQVCLLLLLLTLLSAPVAAMPLSLRDMADILPEWPMTISEAGGLFIFSDSPEEFFSEGILYQDKVKGSTRLYFHHVNGTQEKKRVVILERDWAALRALLEGRQPDYVGNRLHAGIFALNHGCRSRIIAIDNRAAEMGKDTRLPVLPRENVSGGLETAICEEAPLALELPWENIGRWKRQFEEQL